MSEWNNQIEFLLMEVLEQQAFLSSFPIVKSELPEELVDGIEVVIHFKGDRSGCMKLVCSGHFPLELAANVLGLNGPEEVSSEDAEDAVKELLNVYVGQVLGAVSTGMELFELDSPEFCRDRDGSKWSTLRSNEAAFGLLIEDCPALVSLALE